MNNIVVSCTSCGKKNKIPADKQHLRPKCGQCGKSISLTGKGVPVELSDASFQNFINQASLPVMVDFFSPTCGPCRMMFPIVNAMAQKHINKFIIAKLDTSLNGQTASAFSIRGVPSFLFFKRGKLIDQVAGAVSEGTLDQKLMTLG